MLKMDYGRAVLWALHKFSSGGLKMAKLLRVENARDGCRLVETWQWWKKGTKWQEATEATREISDGPHVLYSPLRTILDEDFVKKTVRHIPPKPERKMPCPSIAMDTTFRTFLCNLRRNRVYRFPDHCSLLISSSVTFFSYKKLSLFLGFCYVKGQ